MLGATAYAGVARRDNRMRDVRKCPVVAVNRRARYRHCVYRIPTVRLRLSPVDHTRAAMG